MLKGVQENPTFLGYVGASAKVVDHALKFQAFGPLLTDLFPTEGKRRPETE